MPMTGAIEMTTNRTIMRVLLEGNCYFISEIKLDKCTINGTECHKFAAIFTNKLPVAIKFIEKTTLLPGTIGTEAGGVVCLAEFGLVAWMAGSRSKFAWSMCKLALVCVAAVAVLTVRATQLRLVAGSIDDWADGSCHIILSTNGHSG